jgi:predicted acetyltransferase
MPTTTLHTSAEPAPESLREHAATARFGRLVSPDASHLTAFVAMVQESIATGETDQLVAERRLHRQPSLFLRQLGADGASGVIQFWLASEGEVLATATLRTRGSRWYGNLGFFVRPSRRGQGIGRALMHDLVRHARAHHVTAPEAVAAHDNAASRRAIEAAGGKLRDVVSEYGSTRCIYVFDPHAPDAG